MTPFTSHTGRAVPLRRSNVDTDQIIPAEFCKRITRDGLAEGLFARWRADPDFILNRHEYVAGTILVADTNFGTGSSREHAVWALRDWGFVAVISSRFGDIFTRNALRNGLLPVVLPADTVELLLNRSEADPGFHIGIDLDDCEVTAGAATWSFTVDERARWLLRNGLDDIEVTLQSDADIAVYERARSHWLPQIPRGRRPVSEKSAQ
ncbi:3-isopropylmalate dehydratase small subunit [Micromonospora sp. NPDC048905]|uniref:3-isopropylmalate dehydratase small subunit n=1 Tax=Micromonospora TaxID=1873 RepID=UPI0033CEFD07